MCMQDLAISRGAQIRVTTLTTSAGLTKIRAAPDRIALILNGVNGTALKLFTDPETAASNAPFARSTAAFSITGSLVGALDTYAANLFADVPVKPLHLTAAHYPGLVSAELYITNDVSFDSVMTEILLDAGTSKAIQEALK